MPPIVALIICMILVLVLLNIERKRNTMASLALWIPTIWMLISGSRPVVRWLTPPQSVTATFVSEQGGSPLDRLVLSALILLALLVLYKRKFDWSVFLKDNFWLICLYLYIGFSILWSDFPLVSMRRWIRILGVIPVALVVLSERSPLDALESIFRRCAYLLIPFSLLTIKYFPFLGVQFNRWHGTLMWVGVSTQKNGLGMLCAFSVFFLLWGALRKCRSGDFIKSRSQTLADVLVISIALILIRGPSGSFSYSATATLVLVIGISVLLLLYKREKFTRWIAAHLKAIVIVFAVMFLLFMEVLLPTVTSFFGRDDTLTGRTEIWSLVLDDASNNPLFGIGYGGYWGLNDDITSKVGVKQAHNGYIGVYFELGLVGLLFLFTFLMAFCDKVRREINHTLDGVVLGICFILMLLIYNYAEDTLLKTSFLWTNMIFITVVFSAHGNREQPNRTG